MEVDKLSTDDVCLVAVPNESCKEKIFHDETKMNLIDNLEHQIHKCSEMEQIHKKEIQINTTIDNHVHQEVPNPVYIHDPLTIKTYNNELLQCCQESELNNMEQWWRENHQMTSIMEKVPMRKVTINSQFAGAIQPTYLIDPQSRHTDKELKSYVDLQNNERCLNFVLDELGIYDCRFKYQDFLKVKKFDDHSIVVVVPTDWTHPAFGSEVTQFEPYDNVDTIRFLHQEGNPNCILLSVLHTLLHTPLDFTSDNDAFNDILQNPAKFAYDSYKLNEYYFKVISHNARLLTELDYPEFTTSQAKIDKWYEKKVKEAKQTSMKPTKKNQHDVRHCKQTSVEQPTDNYQMHAMAIVGRWENVLLFNGHCNGAVCFKSAVNKDPPNVCKTLDDYFKTDFEVSRLVDINPVIDIYRLVKMKK